MPAVCLYFQVHQPYRLRKYSFFDIGAAPFYEDAENNRQIMNKIARKCYLPMNELLLRQIRKYDGKFKVSFSFSGVVLDQFADYAPEVLESFVKLAGTGCVEIFDETDAHSLAFLFSPESFYEQVTEHRARIGALFGQKPKVFRNTELIYNNALAKAVEDLGYCGILSEGADRVLGGRTRNRLYRPAGCEKIKLFLKNYSLSDDIAFRFSCKEWQEYPLTAEKFAYWVHKSGETGELVNLFMDYETFGEHQWDSTGIFDFMEALPEKILENPVFSFQTPSDIISQVEPCGVLDVPDFISWADESRDLSAWTGNEMQQDAIHAVYACENLVRAVDSPEMTRTWERLQTSDHFYYMGTQCLSDGDVHKYFNAYSSPYDAYINYMNVLADFRLRLEEREDRKEKENDPEKTGIQNRVSAPCRKAAL